MGDNILRGFRERQFEEGMALAQDSDLLDLMPIEGVPPERYIASFRARGLAQAEGGNIVEANRFDVVIWFPDDYLRRAEAAEVLTYIGPSPLPWHPNIRPPFICVHLRPGSSLVDLLYTLFDVWTWKLYATGDEGLNHAASQWARNQDKASFPIDRRPLKRRRISLSVDVTTQETQV